MKSVATPRYLEGYVQRVNSDGTITGMLDLGFNVHTSVRMAVEGLTLRGLSRAAHDAAMHCMLVLLGGKDFVALVPYREAGTVLARVFLAERVKDTTAPGYTCFEGGRAVLEIGAFMTYLAEHNYDVALVKRALNGRPT